MQKETKILIGKIILGTIATAGVLTVAAIAPNTLQAIDFFYGKDKRRRHQKYYINKKITNLLEKGLIGFEKQNGKKFVRLTEKGEQELTKYQLKELVIKKPKHWDKKWRIIIFDIKEYRKKTREFLRKELINLGFIKLQNSVWVYPYECEEIMIMLKAHLKTGKDILYITAEKIENDNWLKQEFGLK